MSRLAATMAGAILASSLISCTDLRPERAASDAGQLPEQFSVTVADAAESNRWWFDFQAPSLNVLIATALSDNLTLQQLWARLEQADASTIQAASLLYPQVNLESNAGYTRSKATVENAGNPSFGSRLRSALATGVVSGLGQNNAGFPAGTTGLRSNANAYAQPRDAMITRELNQFGLSLAASYELDIWGRIASGYEASKLEAQATRDELEATAITLAAEVAQRWIQITEQEALLEILRQQLETNETYLDLVELRFRKGQVAALDVYQQRQTVSRIKSQIPLVESQAQVFRHQLAVLLGNVPTTPLEVGDYDLTDVPPLPETGVPADLLLKRPDVRAALARLEAADYRVAAARADRLPAIRFTGGIGYNADDISNMFDDWFLNLAAGLSAPLIDGSRRKAEVQRTLAVVQERLAAYRGIILVAIREVEDALVRERKQREYLDALTTELDEANNALREATQRYQKGLSTYLPVLTALERTQALTRTVVNARSDLLFYRINLYRSLGGSWTQTLESPIEISREENKADMEQL